MAHLSLPFFILLLEFFAEYGMSMTSSMTTPPTTPPPPQNKFYSLYGGSVHRHDKKLAGKPIRVIKGVSRPGCLGLCLQRQTGPKSKRCKSFNYKNETETCYLLSTFVCDGDKTLTDAPGFEYFDLIENSADEAEFFQSKQCETRGKCSSKCLKFKLNKTPLSWQEAYNACRSDQALLAMPKTLKDHEMMVSMMKKANVLQIWFGLKKKQGIFYFDDGTLFNQDKFEMWGKDQPNDSGGTQQCVQIMSEMDYKWNDFDCARPVGFMCQYVW